MVMNIQCDGLRQSIELLKSLGATEQAAKLDCILQSCDQVVVAKDEISPSTLPPVIIRGINFAGAMFRWAASGLPRRSQAEIDERLAICQACPQLVDNHCNLCGCACIETNQLMNKLALSTEQCPLGKWK